VITMLLRDATFFNDAKKGRVPQQLVITGDPLIARTTLDKIDYRQTSCPRWLWY
jgi:hypothetical protein